MELKDLEKQYKKIQKQLYYKKRLEALKANPEAYEEFKRKDRERQRVRYLAKKKQNTEPVKKSATVDELKAEIKRLKNKEAYKRAYAKLKADPEKYAKMIERNRKYYLKKKAEKQKDILTVKPIEGTTDKFDLTKFVRIKETTDNPVNIIEEMEPNKEDSKTIFVACNTSVEEITEEEVNKVYDNLINAIRAYVPNFIHTSEIYRALDRYINAYSMFLESNKKVLLSEIIKLFNK